MKVLYFDCGMGAAGDMMTASLYELLSEEEKKAFLEKVNSLGIEGTEVKAQKSVKCGITGTHMQVLVDGREEGHNHEENHVSRQSSSCLKSESERLGFPVFSRACFKASSSFSATTKPP